MVVTTGRGDTGGRNLECLMRDTEGEEDLQKTRILHTVFTHRRDNPPKKPPAITGHCASGYLPRHAAVPAVVHFQDHLLRLVHYQLARKPSLPSSMQAGMGKPVGIHMEDEGGRHARGRSAARKIEGRVEHQPVPGAIIPNCCPMQDISKYFTFAPLPSITTAPI